MPFTIHTDSNQRSWQLGAAENSMATTLTLSEAVTALQQGGVIAYPTEAVWGLGCDPRQETAVHTLLNIKQRASGKGLILVTAELNTLQDWLDLDTLSPERLHEVQASWPGPHTWVLPASTRAPIGSPDTITALLSESVRTHWSVHSAVPGTWPLSPPAPTWQGSRQHVAVKIWIPHCYHTWQAS